MISSKLLDVLHIVIHMGDSDKVFTSDQLSKAMKTNPVVVRRVMAGLKQNRLVTSDKGHGGGWKLSCDLSNVTLLDIYHSVGSPTLRAVGPRNIDPECQVEKVVNNTTSTIFDEAEKIILQRFGEVTIAELGKRVKHRIPDHQPESRKATNG
jgi:DNA-binding IscR family transcriptional regulator